jgi:adenosylcobinamide-GDP ribazoletransferase
MVTTPPAPTTGLGADYTRELRAVAAGSGVAASLVVAVLATGWWAAPLAAAAGVGALGVALLARRAFGGVSGDLLGAVEQVGEILVLVVATALAARHPLWWT